MSERYLNYEEAATFLGLKKATLYALVSQRRVPHVRISGRLVRFSEAALQQWLDERKVSVKRSAGEVRHG